MMLDYYKHYGSENPNLRVKSTLSLSIPENMDIRAEKIQIYNDFLSRFGDLVMTKLSILPRPAPLSPISVYYARIGCLLCDDTRYVIAMTENDGLLVGESEHLSALPWIAFQTRTIDKLPGNRVLGTQSLPALPQASKTMSDRMELSEKKSDRFVYHSQHLPLQIELLIEKESDQYASTGSIRSALDTFSCVISFLI